ncbi:MAG TPA: hypothetical protein VF950_07780 [Planctomycetota bacterium]
MIRFKWDDWNLDKIAAHGLSYEEVEYAFERRTGPHAEREDGSYETAGRTPSGRGILIVWRYDEEYDALGEEYLVEVILVITAYGRL